LPLENLAEGSVPVIDVQIVVLEEVVRDVDVRPAIPIDVTHDHAKTEADLAAKDAGVLTDVHKMSTYVVIEPGTAVLVADVPSVSDTKTADGPR
jgi:hypothetical protein